MKMIRRKSHSNKHKWGSYKVTKELELILNQLKITMEALGMKDKIWGSLQFTKKEKVTKLNSINDLLEIWYHAKQVGGT